MTKIEIVKRLRNRVDTLATMDYPDEDMYWDIKKDLFEYKRIWESEKPCFYWDEALKSDLNKLSIALHETWRKLCRV